MRKQSELLRETIDQKRLFTTVKEVSSYHRIQASTMFREAANYCYNKLQKLGIDSKILTYDANPDVWYLQNKMFNEWDLKDAWLKLEEPDMLLADAVAEPVSIIQKSYPCDFTDGVEFVYLDKGNHPEAYKDVDLKGKLIFVREAFNGYVDWAIKEKGAIGIVTDFIREVEGARSRNDLYESLNYTSFWWTHNPDEPKTFGFVLSPKMGDKLAKIFEKQKEAYEKGEKESPNLKVTGKVDTKLYPGKIEVVEAWLPGESDEEVLISAHLCHPKSSANDNASGVSTAIESLRALKYLMDTGKLQRNKRTIKIILIPEFTGTFAYLSDENKYKKCVGAINMDMVGGKQTRAYGPITLTSLPYSTPSFINDLTAVCMDYAGEEAPTLDGGKVAKTNHTIELFTGGSDHTVFSDPTIGVPCCMIGQWPDLNYHTATDTIDVIDSEVLAYSCHIAALYAYTLSNLDVKDIKEIQNKAHVSLSKRLSDVVELVNNGYELDKAAKLLDHIETFYINSIKDYKRVLDVEDAMLDKEMKWVKASVNQMRDYLEVKEAIYKDDDQRVYVRDFVGPIHSLNDCADLRLENKDLLKEYKDICDKVMGKCFFAPVYNVESMIVYFIDGKNTVSDIIEKVNSDQLGEYDEIVVKFIELLEAMNMVHQL